MLLSPALAVSLAAAGTIVPRELPYGGIVDVLESRYIGVKDGPALNLWDAASGRLLARFEAPSPEYRPEQVRDGANTDVHVLALSADRSQALVSVERRRWRDANKERTVTGAFELHLASVGEQKLLRQLAKGGWETCDEKNGWYSDCPRAGHASFSPDGSRVAYWTLEEAAWYKTAKTRYREDGSALAVGHRSRHRVVLQEASGRVLETKKYDKTYEEESSQIPTYHPRYAPGFLADGRAVLASVEGGGCVVKEWGGKIVTSLEGCVEGRELRMRHGRLWSEWPELRAWDALTGAALGGPSAPGQRVFSEQLDSYAAFTNGASSVSVVVQDLAPGSAARAHALGHPVTAFDAIQFWFDREAGRALVVGNVGGNKYSLFAYELGGPAPAVAAAPAPAPAKDFDEPPASAAKTDPDAYAVVIGVEKYRQEGLPPVDYAARDAETMYAYLTRAMGFDPKNVTLLTDAHATRTDLEKYLGRWLQNRVTAKSRVFVYYAGHGSPDPVTGAGYLMPYEADPSYLDETAYPLEKLYASLAKLPTKDVTVVLDACFSGAGGRSLLAKGARPLVTMRAAAVTGGVVALTASSGAQISASDPERRHGLLSAYLFEALHGEADTDKDGAVSGAEVYSFVRPAVERAAKLQNKEQTPTALPSPEAFKGGRPWLRLKK